VVTKVAAADIKVADTKEAEATKAAEATKSNF